MQNLDANMRAQALNLDLCDQWFMCVARKLIYSY